MNPEQILINKWRLLPPEKQQEVIDFIAFLEQNYSHKKITAEIQNLELENSQITTHSLEGKLIYYEDPYEPLVLEDWKVVM